MSFLGTLSDSVADFVTSDEPTFDEEPTSQHLILDSFQSERTTASSRHNANMPGFADSFWSSDYAGGLGILFQKLQQGVTENQQMLTIASMRADAEEMYSERLGDIAPTIDRMSGGFTRDEGASVKKVSIAAAGS